MIIFSNKTLYILRKTIFFLALCIIHQISFAQTTNPAFRTTQQTNETQQDSLTAEDSVIVKNAFFKLFKGKPGRSALYSLVIPGGGQLYNKKYWKVPIAWGIDGALGYYLWSQNSQYNFYNDRYQNALATGDTQAANVNREQRNIFRRSREFAWMYMVLGHLLVSMDAYVDRHLLEFDISPDISVIPYSASPVVGLAVTVPLHKIRFH